MTMMKFKLNGSTLRSALTFAGYACLFLLGLSAQQTSCKRKTASEAIAPATAARPASFLLQQLSRNRADNVQSFTARANIYAENEGMAVEAVANLVWIRDSLLWLNVKKLGIEAARALITRDSVFIINRLDKTYQQTSIASLQHQYNLPEGFLLLEHLLLGTAWIPQGIELQADIQDSLHRLSGGNALLTVDYRLEEGNFALRRELFLQKRDARLLSAQFSQFGRLSGMGAFPYLRQIEWYSPESGAARLDIQFSEISLNKTTPFRFDIPSHYQRVE